MRSRIVGLWCIALAATVVACSSDGSSSATSSTVVELVSSSTDGASSSDRSSTVDEIVSSATERDIEVDEACVTKVVDQFSDSDFGVLALSAADPEIDAMTIAGQGLVIELVDCTGGRPGATIPPPGGLSTTQTLILEQIKATLDGQGLAYDESCLFDLVDSIETAVVANDAYAADLVTQAQGCITQ